MTDGVERHPATLDETDSIFVIAINAAINIP
jgi:hypothetical protein